MPSASIEATVRREPRRGNTADEQGDTPRDLMSHLTEYAQQNPTTCAGWCFVIGFVLGWRLKPW